MSRLRGANAVTTAGRPATRITAASAARSVPRLRCLPSSRATSGALPSYSRRSCRPRLRRNSAAPLERSGVAFSRADKIWLMKGLARIIVAVAVLCAVASGCYLAGAIALLFCTGTGPGSEITVGRIMPLIYAASGLAAIVAAVMIDRVLRRTMISN